MKRAGNLSKSEPMVNRALNFLNWPEFGKINTTIIKKGYSDKRKGIKCALVKAELKVPDQPPIASCNECN